MDYGTFPSIGKRLLNEMLFNLGAYMTPQVAYMQDLGLRDFGRTLSRSSGNFGIGKKITYAKTYS